MNRSLALLAALAASFVAVPAAMAANPLKPEKFVFDPARGYILVRVGPVGDSGNADPVYFVRMDPAHPGQTLWSFGMRPINSKKESDAAMVWGGDNFGNDGKTSLYLVPVNPGEWVIGGAGGTSMSLGSYGFTVKPGEITYVGTILTGRENGKSDIPEIKAATLSQDLVEFGTLMNIVMSDAILVTPSAAGDPIPEAIASHGVTHASLIPGVRFNNFLAAMINRAIGLEELEHQLPAVVDSQGAAEAPEAPSTPSGY
ncbi:MAG TPA: hypothetical protein VK472_03430 [Allosphingosinicella sp.]|nr:hypothetical protein [Allosphingosinicella sp.]